MTVSDTLHAEFESAEISLAADGIPTVRVALADLLDAVDRARGPLQHRRFVDVTAVDRLTREDRFELVYLFYSLEQHTWLRLKTRTDRQAPSITPIVPGANWYEREVYDLFGIRFDGHPDLTRILMPDDWIGHPLRKDDPSARVPVTFKGDPSPR